MMIPKNLLRILALLILLSCGLSQQTYAQFSGSGTGTESDPYIITNVTQLQEMQNDLTAHYELGNDIDASATSSWNDGAGFEPIGGTFSGILDGNDFIISGLIINRSSEGNVGIFDSIKGQVKNVRLSEVNVIGGSVVGALASRNLGTIESCSVNGIIEGEGYVGGLIGSHFDDLGLISNSNSTGEVIGNFYVGGLVGRVSYDATIQKSYSESNVKGSGDRVGGLIGSVEGDDSLISECFAIGEVNGGTTNTGGLIGFFSEGKLERSYAFGNVYGDSRVGGLVGGVNFYGTLYDTFALGNVSGDNYVGGVVGSFGRSTIYRSYAIGKISGNSNVGGVFGQYSYSNSSSNSVYYNGETTTLGGGYTTDQMVQESSFGFDFTNKWQIYEGYSFPFLRDVGDHLTTVLEITGSENWRTMSSPLKDVSYGDLFVGLWTQGFTDAVYEGGTPNIYTHSESSQNWDPVSNASEMPGTGEGFLMYVYEDDEYGESGSFPKTVVHSGSQRFGSSELPVSLTKSGSGGAYVASDDGWNLVGNPYASPINWDASGWNKSGLSNSIYVWSEQDDDYRTWNGSTGSLGSGVIAPWQGFWVKADDSGSPSLEVDEGARASGGQFLKGQEYPVIEFTLNGGNNSSGTFIMLHPEASRELDRLDAWKLQPLSSDYLSFYSLLNDGHALDINTLPDELEEPISIDFDIDGTTLNDNYQLSWQPEALPSDIIFVLTDNITNEQIELTGSSTYSFEISGVQENAKRRLKGNQPAHRVIKPKVLQAKTRAQEREPRFTLTISSTTSVSQPELPATVGLKQNYPNPFNPSTVIRYQLPVSSDVELSVFDLTGRQVATLVDGVVQAGTHQATFDGSRLSSGVYVYRLVAGGQQITRKLTLIK